MPSICLTGVAFTLKGQPPEQNKYLRILLTWMAQILKAGGLQSDDRLVLFIDSVSIQYLQENTVFETLFEAFPCHEKQVMIIPPPTTLIEGTCRRFMFFPYTQDIFLYLDIDIFVLQPLHSILDLPKGVLACQIEGLYLDSNYSEGQPANPDPLTPGFSDGKFCITDKNLHQRICAGFFEIVDMKSKFYTIEQPFFNTVVQTLNPPLHTTIFENPRVITTAHEYQKGRTWLLDFAGSPGDGEKHWEHIFDAFFLTHAGIF
jgi:hypothetical protein